MFARDFRPLSLTARLAAALCCFERLCKKLALSHPEIDSFLDHLWRFPTIPGGEYFVRWEQHDIPLISVGLGYEYPDDLERFLRERAVDPGEFRRLLESTVEIVFGSFYGAADDEESFRYLGDVFAIAEQHGIAPPAAGHFAKSRFSDGGGWGNKLTGEETDGWRLLGQRCD